MIKSDEFNTDDSKIGASIDEIAYLYDDVFSLTLIPDFAGEFFLPMHLRQVNVSAELLSGSYLEWLNRYNSYPLSAERFNSLDRMGSVIQGGYYTLPKSLFWNKIRSEINPNIIYNYENDIFKENRIDSIYNDLNITGKQMIGIQQINNLSTLKSSGDNTYLYGFYVGQGDMLLLITSEKNAYIIDTNIYNSQGVDMKCNEIKHILRCHGMNDYRLKGLIITHKHLDHIRGASKLIESGKFDFEYFIMNLDYHHPTAAVEMLLKSANAHIDKWVNLNGSCSIYEGKTSICFKNPTEKTRQAPDINDSSIVICIRHEKNLIYLTGDACAPILEGVMKCRYLKYGTDRVLKVSHHGSRTGSSVDLMNLLNPKKAFISAGDSKKFKHPHKECTDELISKHVDTSISKYIKSTVEYSCDGKNINKRLI